MPIKEPPPLLRTAEEPEDENNQNNANDELLTTEELAKLWKVNPKTIQRKVREGELEAVDLFGEYRFVKGWLREYLKKRKVKPQEGNASGQDSA